MATIKNSENTVTIHSDTTEEAEGLENMYDMLKHSDDAKVKLYPGLHNRSDVGLHITRKQENDMVTKTTLQTIASQYELNYHEKTNNDVRDPHVTVGLKTDGGKFVVMRRKMLKIDSQNMVEEINRRKERCRQEVAMILMRSGIVRLLENMNEE